MGREEAGWSGMLYDSTPAQRQFTLAASWIVMVVASVCAGLSQVPWATWQWALMLFVAFDLGGGVAAMCLPPAIRKVRPAKEPLKPLMFAAFHIHPLLLALVFPDQDWTAMFVLYGAGVAGAAAAGLAPDAYRAGVSLAWCACVLPIVQLLGPMPGLAWLAPAYLLKLVGSHAAPLPWSERS